MGSDKKVSCHVAYEQVKAMIDFMGQNGEFATGNLRTLEARYTSKRLWAELTKILNECKGTKKSADGWSKYWSDFKNKLKNKVRTLKRPKRGSTVKQSIRPLTKLEKRVLVILGPHFDKKLSKLESAENPLSNNILPEVKLEAYQDSGDISKSQDDIQDRISGSEDEFDESGESSMDDCEDGGDIHLPDPLIQNLYPKWLVEVEKKRAEAELLRAKADVKRASAAAKSAKAALMQAEAMKKLAEAAATQAVAITRIAAAMESHSQVEYSTSSVSSTGQCPG